jgi:AbrB family looped-hinge helix DNA binding protein
MASRCHFITSRSTAASASAVPQPKATDDVHREDAPMPSVRIDAQGRIVVPLAERQRLGIRGGDELTLLPTPEGLVLERRRSARVSTAPDGLPIVDFVEPRPVLNEEAVAAIRAERATR